MAHTYVIQSVHTLAAPVADPKVLITGTVDGVPVQAETWLSVFTANGSTAIAAQNFCIAQMLAAFNVLGTTIPTNAPPGGTTITQ